MLYVYYVNEDFETLEQEVKYNAVINNKDLKEWDGYYYIGKEKSFVLNGIKIEADEELGEFIKEYWSECVNEEYTVVSCPSLYNLEFRNDYILNVICDDLKDDTFEYEDRIFNAENPYLEVKKIMDGIIIDWLYFAIDDVKHKTYTI